MEDPIRKSYQEVVHTLKNQLKMSTEPRPSIFDIEVQSENQSINQISMSDMNCKQPS